MRRKFIERVVARRESPADLRLEGLELRVHAIAPEPFAEIDERGRVRGAEAGIEHDDGRNHDENRNPRVRARGRDPAVASTVVGGRRVATACLVGLTCVLTVFSAVALWLRALVLNTDSYVRAIAPVLDHPEVRDALSQAIVDALYSHVDVTAQLSAALPKSAAEFAPTLAAGIRTTAVEVASAALATPAARTAWRDANRVAHDQLVRELEGRGQLVTTARGEVAIDTGPLAAAVLRALDSHGIHLFDAIPVSTLDQRFVLFRSTALTRAQRATHLLDELATWLPIATVAAGAGAIAASTRRRRTVEHLVLAVATTMVVVSIGAAVGRSFYLARVGAAYHTIAAAPFDALVHPLRLYAQVIFAVTVALFVALWLAASQTAVERERRAGSLAFALVRQHAHAFAIGGAAVGAVLLVAWDRPRPLVVFVLLGVLALWEVLCFVAGATGPRAGGTHPAAPD